MPLEGHDPEHDAAYAGDDVSANERNNSGSGLPPINCHLEPPQSPPPQNPAPQESSKWRENTKLGLEIFGLLVLTVYTAFAGLQWRQIRWTNILTREALDGSDKALRQTLDKMQQQVDAANTANKETHNLLAVTQGAVFQILVDYNRNEGTNPYVGVHAMNIGKTTAHKFSGESKYVRLDKNGKLIQSARKRFADDTVSAGSAPFQMFSVIPSYAEAMEYLPERFRITTTIEYDDGFGNTRAQNVCREMVVTPRQGIGWIDCGNAKEWKQNIK